MIAWEYNITCKKNPKSKHYVLVWWQVWKALVSSPTHIHGIFAFVSILARATLGDMAISSNNCIKASWWIMLKKWKLQQVLVYSLAIIAWVNNFQAQKNQGVLSSFFVTVMILHMVVIGVGGGEWT